MKLEYRHQNDGEQEFFSDIAVIDCSEDPDLVRHEFDDDADINKLLPKFGTTLPMRPPIFADIDFTQDLQSSFQSIRDLQDAYARLPQDLRASYKTWDDLLRAIDAQELKINFTEQPAEQPPAVPPA